MSHEHCTTGEAQHWNDGYAAGRIDAPLSDHAEIRGLCGKEGHLFVCVGCGETADIARPEEKAE